MKKIVRFCLCFLLCFFAGYSTACGSNEDPIGNEVTLESLDMDRYENDYVHMWYGSGVMGQVINLQSPYYAATIDGKTAQVKTLGIYEGAKAEYSKAKYENLNSIKMDLNFTKDGATNSYLRTQANARFIESGRYCNAVDNVNLRFKDSQSGPASKILDDYYGRLEISGSLYSLAINFGMFKVSAVTDDAAEAGKIDEKIDMRFSLDFGEGFESRVLDDESGVTVLDTKGNGFAFLPPKEDSDISVSATGGKVVCEKKDVTIKKLLQKDIGNEGFVSYGVVLVPIKEYDMGSITLLRSIEKCAVTATALTPYKGDLDVRYDAYHGRFIVETGQNTVTQMGASHLNDYEKVRFKITNPTGQKLKIPLRFNKPSGTLMLATGISPMIRDIDTLEPIGTQVQISKNWHSYSYMPGDWNYMKEVSPDRYLEGKWLHAYVDLPLDGGSERSYEYTCAYGNWGETLASSYAQLSLIGWHRSPAVQWDQAALGSWGEQICFEPDGFQNNAFIQDVRPVLVSPQYGWTGNVGGGSFLVYENESGWDKLINNRTTYVSQAPCLPTVRYTGNSTDGKIVQDVTAMLVRSNDVNRNYFRIRYFFNEDTYFNRLVFFKYSSDDYTVANTFSKYAYGDSAGAIEYDRPSVIGKVGYLDGKKNLKTKQDGFWFYAYDAAKSTLNDGSSFFTVRDYKACLNGKKYDKPEFSLYVTNAGGSYQTTCEISPNQEAGNVIQKGSYVDMLIEFAVMPADGQSYYGGSDYVSQNAPKFGTWDAGYYMQQGGSITGEAAVGEIVSTYPILIRADETADRVVAEFRVKGGLGYIPIQIGNLRGYSGYTLQKQKNGSWEDVDQSVKGKDFWQTHYDATEGTYMLTYTVENTDGIDFYAESAYRLIKK